MHIYDGIGVTKKDLLWCHFTGVSCDENDVYAIITKTIALGLHFD